MKSNATTTYANMKTNHTTGNWHAHDGQIYPEETGKTLALIPYFDKDNEEQQTNARLIAAAPDMLEALINCKEWFVLNFKSKNIIMKGVGAPAFLTELNEAIQKATQP